MKTFKQFLSEMHYGSLVNQDKLDSLDPDEQDLYKYTADGFTYLSSEAIHNLAKKYPYDGGTLYRGLHFESPEDEEKWNENFNEHGKTHLNGMSSWTPDLGTAVGFARTVKTYFPTQDVMHAHSEMTKAGDRMTGHGGVVLRVKVPAGIGLDVNKTDFAKESEVILPGGDYEISIERTLNPLRREIASAESAHEHVLKLVAMHKKVAKGITGEVNDASLKLLKRDRDELSTYLHASWAEHLSPDDCDKLFMVSLGRYLERIEDNPDDSCAVKKEQDLFERGSYNLEVYCGALLPDNSPILNYVTDKLKKRVHKANVKLAKVLEKKLDDITDVANVQRISVSNVAGLSAAIGHDIGAKLRMKFAAEYHRLNSREYNRSLDLSDRRAMDKHMKRITAIVQALGEL